MGLTFFTLLMVLWAGATTLAYYFLQEVLP